MIDAIITCSSLSCALPVDDLHTCSFTFLLFIIVLLLSVFISSLVPEMVRYAKREPFLRSQSTDLAYLVGIFLSLVKPPAEPKDVNEKVCTRELFSKKMHCENILHFIVAQEKHEFSLTESCLLIT